MRAPILRRLDATIEIDPILGTMDHELERLGAAVAVLEEEKRPEAQALLAQAQADRDAYHAATDEKPLVRIRMLPPDVLAAFRKDLVRAPLAPAEESRDELAEAIDRTRKFNRGVCRFGVAGWKIQAGGESVQCPLVVEELSGREYDVAADSAVDFLEANGLLDPVALAIWRFSSLQEEDRKK